MHYFDPETINAADESDAPVLIQASVITRTVWTLVYADTGKPVVKGTILPNFRGEAFAIVGGKPPHKPSSTGSVISKAPNPPEFEAERYPSVFGLEWRKH